MKAAAATATEALRGGGESKNNKQNYNRLGPFKHEADM